MAAALAAVLGVVVLATQELIAVGGGAGWDGSHYLRMLDPEVVVDPPFGQRIGWPFIVRHLSLSADPLTSFRVVALLFGTLHAFGSLLLLVALFPAASHVSRLVAWAALNLSELAPLRLAGWSPTTTDIPANLAFLLLVGLLMLPMPSVVRVLGLAAGFFVGVTIRENFVLNLGLVILVFVVHLKPRRVEVEVGRRALVPVVAAVCGALLGALAVKASTGLWVLLGQATVAFQNLREARLATALQAVLSVYGFPLLVELAALGLDRRRLSGSPALGLFLLSTLPVAFIGGGNIERFLFWYIPLAILLVLPSLEAAIRSGRWFELSVAVAYLVLMHRMLLPIHTTAGVALDEHCSLPEYLAGGTPHLSHFVQICGVDPLPAFYALFLIAAFLTVLPRVRFVAGPAWCRRAWAARRSWSGR